MSSNNKSTAFLTEGPTTFLCEDSKGRFAIVEWFGETSTLVAMNFLSVYDCSKGQFEKNLSGAVVTDLHRQSLPQAHPVYGNPDNPLIGYRSRVNGFDSTVKLRSEPEILPIEEPIVLPALAEWPFPSR